MLGREVEKAGLHLENLLGQKFFSVSEQVALHGRFRPSDTALVSDGRSVNWAEFNSSGNRIANALIADGLEQGDRVAFIVSNTLWAYELILGIWRAGGALVPLSPMLTSDSLSVMIEDCEARLLLASGEFHDLAHAAAAERGIPVVGEGESFATFLGDAKPDDPGVRIGPEDLCNIIYSSGTTGTPKGIPHTHYARAIIGLGVAADFGFSRSSRSLALIPPHSNGGWLAWLPALMVGCPTVVLNGFEVGAFLQAVRDYQPTHGFLVPTICQVLLESEELRAEDLRCFDCAITAGSPMSPTLKEQMLELTADGLWELWGLTEGVATIISPQEMRSRLNSVGRPMTGCDLRRDRRPLASAHARLLESPRDDDAEHMALD
jgi:acyl-CoA synthetase (AMP-forming)/AMP-acid ligase II